MKIFSKKIISCVFILSIIFSCSEEKGSTDLEGIETTIQKTEVQFSKPGVYSKATSQKGFITITLEDINDEEFSFELSQNLIDFIEIPKDELYNLIKNELELSGYNSKGYSSKSSGGISDCKSKCNDDYTDENGGK